MKNPWLATQAQDIPVACYPKIDIDPLSQVRIVELLPGAPRDEIRCKLKVVDQPSSGEADSVNCANHYFEDYEALSYTWGSWKDHKWITLEDRPFPVTSNLFGALRRLRRPDVPRKLFIDQLSINQHGLRERNHQVRLMGKVYSHSSRVVVWLGDVQDSSIVRFRKDCEPSKQLRALEEDGLMFLEDLDFKLQKMAFHEAVGYTRPHWWKRVWVVQEIAKAQSDIVFVCGGFEIPLDRLPKMDRPEGRTIFEAVKSFRSTQQSLVSMRKIITGTVSTNPRDKVYGLLGLIGRTEKTKIEVDYSKTSETVYAEATVASFSSNNPYGLMAYVTAHRSLLSKLPSWAFDFNSSHYSDVEKPSGNDSLLRVQDQFPLPIEHTVGESTLTIRARHFDKISAVFSADHYWTSGFGSCSPSHIEKVLLPMAQQLTSICPYSLLRQQQNSPESTSGSGHKKIRTNILAKRMFYEAKANPILVPELCAAWYSCLPSPYTVEKFDRTLFASWVAYLNSVSSGKATLFTTEAGFIGLGQTPVKEGDTIILPQGSDAPMILRETWNSAWTFQGFAFVNGIMGGELGDMNLADAMEYALV